MFTIDDALGVTEPDASIVDQSAQSIFATTRWHQFARSLDLSQVIGGKTNYQQAIVRGDAGLVSCPVMSLSGNDRYFLYHLRRFYFEQWIAEAKRMHPEKARTYSRLGVGVGVFRRLLALLGCEFNRLLLVAHPLSYRTSIISQGDGPSNQMLIDELLSGLEEHSRKTRQPIWFFAVDERDELLSQSLKQRGYASSFLIFDTELDLAPFADFQAYLHSFSRTTRRAFERDIDRCAKAGVTFSFRRDFSRDAKLLAEQYEATYAQFGESHFHHPEWFWQQLEQSLGDSAEIIEARYQGALVGFSVLLLDRVRKTLWTYRIGRADVTELAKVPTYFYLTFYGPIQRAFELGLTTICFGPASYQAKTIRGAKLIPLRSYFYFPKWAERTLLAPYLSAFGDISRKEMEASAINRS